MIKFLLKGLLRDRSRSLFPVLTVAVGVMLTVFLQAWINGAVSGLIQSTAHYQTGHLCVMTRAYASRVDQNPNDLALLGVDTILASLKTSYPDLYWTPRIRFGGLLDIPDEKGETKEQAPVAGMGVNLFSAGSPEWKILNIRSAIVRGKLPAEPGDLLIAEELAEKLHLQPGQKVTLISSTMYGSMTYMNFTIAGTVRFGIESMDRSTIIADLSDMQQALDMQQGAGEILGFFRDDLYHEDTADSMAHGFNARCANAAGKFSPMMETLRNQTGLSDYLDLVGEFTRLMLGIFVFVMSIVLWNAGLSGSLRRYGEFGLRLAVGEDKGHIYRAMIIESLAVGIAGSIAGTAIGAACAYYLQVHGFDIGSLMKNSTMMLTDVIRAQVEPLTFIIGFLPGMLATVLGSAISGIGIYKRQTSQLFKELET
ncbi:MAG: FtsX-like permease family protein [Bacteroidota bacterium]